MTEFRIKKGKMKNCHPACKKCELNDNCWLQEYDELFSCADVMNYKKPNAEEVKKGKEKDGG